MGAEASTSASPPVQPAESKHSTPSALVIVGPSGVGKGTLISRLMQGAGSEAFGFSVSHTTRDPRPGEKHAEHYYFTTKEQFAKEVGEGKFLEYAEVHGNLYGTSLRAVQSVLETGRVCILDIDIQGARSVRTSGLRAIFVFVAPPSLEDLATRLARRGTETVEQIRRRLDNAKKEIESLNERPPVYDYLLVNDNLEECLLRLRAIAARAAAGLDAEPGQIPDKVTLEQPAMEALPVDVPAEATQEPAPQAAPVGEPTPSAPASSAPAPSVPASTAAAVEEVSGSNIVFVSSNAGSSGGSGAAQVAGEFPAPVTTSVSVPSTSPPSGMTVPSETLVVLPSLNHGSVPSTQTTSMGQSPATDPVLQSGDGAPATAYQAPTFVPPAYGNMARWQGKVALVTGASSGIGWDTCEALALAGLHVVAIARRKDRLEALQLHMHDLGITQSAFLPIVCDITKEAEVAMLPRIVSKRWPGSGIDVLVNNAGLARNDASLFEGSVASWVEMLSTNVLGTCLCTKAVLADMQQRHSYGHILNIIGLSGHRIPDGPQGGSFYCATKAAVKVITEGLRQEARGRNLPLRVSGISPGIVETEFFTVRAFGDEEAGSRAMSVKKALQPEDIAQAVLWCLTAPDHVEVNDIVIRPTEQLL